MLIIYAQISICGCQTSAPNHYYDFAKIKSVNGMKYAFDQRTKSDITAFGFLTERKCPSQQISWPQAGPEGLQFTTPTDSLRLENSNNLQMTDKFLIAVWIKMPFCDATSQFCRGRQETYITQQKFENPGVNNILYQLGLSWQTDKIQFMAKVNQVPYPGALLYGQVTRYAGSNAKLAQGGWFLLALSVDSSSYTKTMISMRIRGGPNGNDNVVFTENGKIYMDAEAKKCDTFIGAYCFNNQEQRFGPSVIISRLYIWKSFSNIDRDSEFDQYFFRAGNSMTPTCQGLIACKFCIIGLQEFTTSPTVDATLKCPTENSNYKIILANWDFDDETKITKYIKDKSGNGINFMKEPLDDITSNEVSRIYGQGYMFYGLSYLRSVLSPNLYSYPQFTVDIWLRKYLSKDDFHYPVTDKSVRPFRIIDGDGNTLLEVFIDNITSSIGIEDSAGKRIVQMPDADIFSSTNWHFFQITFNRFNAKNLIDSQEDPLFQYSDTARLKIENSLTMIYKSMKIYSYAKTQQEMSLSYSTSCGQIGNQDQCEICPLETNKCLSKCNLREYGENCDICHKFCEHCTGPNVADCVSCSRNGNDYNSLYSKTYGNCTCKSGYYYDKGNNKCDICHGNCQECFGPEKSQCFYCKDDKSFYPPFLCVEDCKDQLVTQGGSGSFYERKQSMNGKEIKICSKCHPYCKTCFGDLNTQCDECQLGYFQKDQSCFDVCPPGFYSNSQTMECDPCHADCALCSGPGQDKCIKCANPALYQTSGMCKDKCDDNKFPDVTSKTCQGCNKACVVCTTRFASDCSSCSPGYYLEWQGTTCRTYCEDGYYPDDVTNQCLMCHYSCETCTGAGPDMCTICSPGYYRKGKLCVSACAFDEFLVNDTCRSCDPKCSSCFGISQNQCYTCAENLDTGIGYFQHKTSCLSTCPDGFYPDYILKICSPCKPECATCNSLNFCTSCVYGPYQLNDGECTHFTCLDTQYRALKPQLSCFECDSTCQTCQGVSKYDCLSCKAKDKFVAQQCLSCNQQPGMTEPLDDSSTECIEICGDGFNYGFYQCDDGNLINGDGCSSTCSIEQGYYCTPGTKYTPSICQDNKNPTPRVSMVTANNLIYIEFDEEVILSEELNSNTLDVQITGIQSQYKFDWKLSDAYKITDPVQIIVIELSVYQSLKGEEKERLSLTFLSPNTYKDPTGNGMALKPLYTYLNKYDYINPETKAKLEAAGDSSMMATLVAVLINLGISLVFGGSVSAMWTMVNTIQLISLLPLCDVNYPGITLLIFEKMLGSHGESTIIPNLLYDKLIARPGTTVELEPALNFRFNAYGWKISNFIYLSGRKIILWTLIILAYPFVWYMKRKYADKHKFCRVWVDAESKFRYTMLLRGVIMSYVSMYLAFILGIFQMDLSTMENTVSAFTAIAFGIILTYLPILLMNILQRNYIRIETPKFMAAYSTIVSEVDLSHPIRYMYYPVFLLRRAIFAISLVMLNDKPFLQIIFMSATAIAMMIYVVVIKPQKQRIMMILTAYGEGLLLFLHVFSILFLDKDIPEEKSNMYGWIIILVIGVYIIINWVVIIIVTVSQMKEKWRNYKLQKLKNKSKLIEDKEYKKWKKKKQIKQRISKELEKQSMIERFEQEQQREREYLNNMANSPSYISRKQVNHRHKSMMSPFNLPDYSKSPSTLLHNNGGEENEYPNIFQTKNQTLLQAMEEDHRKRSFMNSMQVYLPRVYHYRNKNEKYQSNYNLKLPVNRMQTEINQQSPLLQGTQHEQSTKELLSQEKIQSEQNLLPSNNNNSNSGSSDPLEENDSLSIAQDISIRNMNDANPTFRKIQTQIPPIQNRIQIEELDDDFIQLRQKKRKEAW
ncbi:UNKNOWN [Stylonychia lemnae]|uniref:Fu domain containing protein n=1 Tax=Stylonychia lemnae TaxID=5949 RepID=A0A078AF38_STYLE|nr:UNKNOWN [Stylonychia lemnae]|eukprot:CDW80137.1 UNKNOWN [Stylonychia lemnae]